MAGRPRRMLATVTSLEERVWDIREDLTRIMPERYWERDERMRDDPLWIAWYLSSYELDGTMVWLTELRILLEQKVGGGRTTCEDAEDKALENAERAAT